MNRRPAFVAVTFMAIASACSANDVMQPHDRSAAVFGDESLEIVKLSGQSGPYHASSSFPDSARIVVRDAELWTKLWGQIWQDHSPIPPVADVDFSRDMLIVAGLGTRPSGGYAIQIDSVYRRPQNLEVVLRKISPDANCIVTGALTHPIDIARVPRTNLPVHFRERSLIRKC